MPEPTPTTPEGLQQFDHLPAAEAVVLAWVVPGHAPRYHRDMQDLVRKQMPVLARAIERLVDQTHTETKDRRRA